VVPALDTTVVTVQYVVTLYGNVVRFATVGTSAGAADSTGLENNDLKPLSIKT
jgi:hypothetical protein